MVGKINCMRFIANIKKLSSNLRICFISETFLVAYTYTNSNNQIMYRESYKQFTRAYGVMIFLWLLVMLLFGLSRFIFEFNIRIISQARFI